MSQIKVIFQRVKVSTCFLFIALGILGSCTGINIFRSVYGFEGNTNPTPEYTSISILYKGGGVIHRNTVPGALGKPQQGEIIRAEACSWSAAWLIAGGDSSIQAAKRNGGIDFVHSIEYKQEATFGFLLHNFCTIILGTKAELNQPGTGEESGPLLFTPTKPRAQ